MRKYYNLELTKTISVTSLKTVEELMLDANFFYPVETHRFYELIYVLSGEIFCENDGNTIPLKAGEFKLTLPNVAHKYSAKNETQIFIICFQCKSNVLSVLDEPTYLENPEKMLIEKLISETEQAFELPFKERVVLKKDAPLGAQQITENIIEELLIRLLRKRLAEDKIHIVKNKSELQKNLVNDIEAILMENVYNKITLDDICKKLYYSNTYLNNIFKKHKKTTIIQYYISLKIEESKKLLKKDLSIAEISDKLCFDNPNYFGKMFKSITGSTPSKYKQME